MMSEKPNLTWSPCPSSYSDVSRSSIHQSLALLRLVYSRPKARVFVRSSCMVRQYKRPRGDKTVKKGKYVGMQYLGTRHYFRAGGLQLFQHVRRIFQNKSKLKLPLTQNK